METISISVPGFLLNLTHWLFFILGVLLVGVQRLRKPPCHERFRQLVEEFAIDGGAADVEVYLPNLQVAIAQDKKERDQRMRDEQDASSFY